MTMQHYIQSMFPLVFTKKNSQVTSAKPKAKRRRNLG